MTLSLGERAIESVAVLVESIRTNAGWSTDAGAYVRRSFVFVDLTEELYWESLVFEALEDLAGYQGGPVVAATGLVFVKQQINVCVFTRTDPGNESAQYQRIKADTRKALSPPLGRLSDSAGTVGTIEHLGAELIEEKLSSGVIGVKTKIIVHFTEIWGNPARAP
jgi:hypothetical protein